MTPHEIAEKLFIEYKDCDINEADTRHKIIDVVLHDILQWPREFVDCEGHSAEGFSDYVLCREDKHPLLVIEAKKSGTYFTLPSSPEDKIALRRVKLRTLMTDSKINSAVRQVKGYATDRGCSLAAITNGQVWIIFKAYTPGKTYTESKALVIPQLSSFSQLFTDIFNLLSFTAVTRDNALANEFSTVSFSSEEILFPKKQIIQYDASMNANGYAKYLRPICDKFLGDIPKDDTAFMTTCYVEPRGIRDVFNTIYSDVLTPYFENDGVRDIEGLDSEEPSIARHMTNSMWNLEGRKVIILFGGKGCGKSTFLERLLFFKSAQKMANISFPVILNLLMCPQSITELEDYIWKALVTNLDYDHLMSGNIENLLSLFCDKYEIAQRQSLAGLSEDSTEFIVRRNDLIDKMKSDLRYCAKRLKEYWLKKSKRLLIVLDNTDQLPSVLQDKSFLIAQEIATELDCLVVISMREERYCRAKTNGVLDAYHNSGYHLPAPETAEVFKRRLEHIIRLLQTNDSFTPNLNIPENAPANDLIAFLTICIEEFNKPAGHLKTFLDNCSHGNLRLALDFFRDYMSSGYTQIEEMINAGEWTIAQHQVLTPIMVPKRQNYEEDKSAVPNLYQLRNPAGMTSHFTGLRLLSFLNSKAKGSSNDAFVDVSSILHHFNEIFSMKEDCECLLDKFLQYGIVEADNRVDQYKTERLCAGETGRIEYVYADRVKITAFGQFLRERLSASFTYLYLVSLDCGVRDAVLCESLCRASNEERNYSIQGGMQAKSARLESRMNRVGAFIQYLKREEDREREYFNLDLSEMEYTPSILSHYVNERAKIMESAQRRFGQYE